MFAKMMKFVAALIVSAMFINPFVSAASAQSTTLTEEDRNELQERLDEKGEEVDEAEAKVAEAKRKLETLKRRLDAARAVRPVVTADVTAAEANVTTAERELADAEAAKRRLEQDLDALNPPRARSRGLITDSDVLTRIEDVVAVSGAVHLESEVPAKEVTVAVTPGGLFTTKVGCPPSATVRFDLSVGGTRVHEKDGFVRRARFDNEPGAPTGLWWVDMQAPHRPGLEFVYEFECYRRRTVPPDPMRLHVRVESLAGLANDTAVRPVTVAFVVPEEVDRRRETKTTSASSWELGVNTGGLLRTDGTGNGFLAYGLEARWFPESGPFFMGGRFVHSDVHKVFDHPRLTDHTEIMATNVILGEVGLEANNFLWIWEHLIAQVSAGGGIHFTDIPGVTAPDGVTWTPYSVRDLALNASAGLGVGFEHWRLVGRGEWMYLHHLDHYAALVVSAAFRF